MHTPQTELQAERVAELEAGIAELEERERRNRDNMDDLEEVWDYVYKEAISDLFTRIESNWGSVKAFSEREEMHNRIKAIQRGTFNREIKMSRYNLSTVKTAAERCDGTGPDMSVGTFLIICDQLGLLDVDTVGLRQTYMNLSVREALMVEMPVVMKMCLVLQYK